MVRVPTADHNQWDQENDILIPISKFLKTNFKPVELIQKINSVPDWLTYSTQDEEIQPLEQGIISKLIESSIGATTSSINSMTSISTSITTGITSSVNSITSITSGKTGGNNSENT